MARWRISFIEWQNKAEAANRQFRTTGAPDTIRSPQACQRQPRLNPMNTPLLSAVRDRTHRQLREYLVLCARTSSRSTSRESQALAAAGDYQPFEFYQGRKALLSRLDQALNLLRTWRQAWQRLDPRGTRAIFGSEIVAPGRSGLFGQDSRARPRKPASPAPAGVGARPSCARRSPAQPPHYAAQLYRRHSS